MREISRLTLGKNQAKVEAQINQYLEYCQVTRRMSPMTLSSKISTYRIFVNESHITNLTELDNTRFDEFMMAEDQRGISARTINIKIAHIVVLVKYWREMGLEIPLRIPLINKLKELPPRRKFYTSEEIDEVLMNCTSEMQWLLIKIAFDTGMRISELARLSLDQIYDRRINFIGKGTKAREVYICQDTRERLTHYIDKHQITDRLWISRLGNPASVDTLRKVMKEAFVRCGHPEFYPHALRHSFGSDIQRHGADVMVIKEMMGHSNVATTQRYLHGFEGKLEDLFNQYRG